MKINIKRKQFWLPGLALMAAFAILTASGMSFDILFSHYPSLGVIATELLAFGVPGVLLYAARDSSFRIRLRMKRRRGYFFQYFGFTIEFALIVSFLSFLANLVVYILSGTSQFSVSGIVSGNSGTAQSTFMGFLAIVVIPPLVEEFFMRGVLFSAMENVAGTKVCIIMSGLCFAFMHADVFNFVGPFLAGCAYAYLTYAYDSIWPAIIAHMINNLYYFLISRLLSLYSSFGIWNYFTVINGILFLVMLYLTLRSLELQLYHEKLLPLKPTLGKLQYSINDLVGNPGFFIFAVGFFFTVLFNLL